VVAPEPGEEGGATDGVYHAPSQERITYLAQLRLSGRLFFILQHGFVNPENDGRRAQVAHAESEAILLQLAHVPARSTKDEPPSVLRIVPRQKRRIQPFANRRHPEYRDKGARSDLAVNLHSLDSRDAPPPVVEQVG